MGRNLGKGKSDFFGKQDLSALGPLGADANLAQFHVDVHVLSGQLRKVQVCCNKPFVWILGIFCVPCATPQS